MHYTEGVTGVSPHKRELSCYHVAFAVFSSVRVGLCAPQPYFMENGPLLEGSEFWNRWRPWWHKIRSQQTALDMPEKLETSLKLIVSSLGWASPAARGTLCLGGGSARILVGPWRAKWPSATSWKLPLGAQRQQRHHRQGGETSAPMRSPAAGGALLKEKPEHAHKDLWGWWGHHPGQNAARFNFTVRPQPQELKA